MITWLLMISAFAVGVVVGRFAWRQKPHAPFTATTPEPGHTYGHPWPPVPALRKKLPAPPSGHTWEIKVTTNSSGDSILTLTLVRVLDGANIGSRDCNLTRTSYHTWAHQYRNYTSIHKSIFNNDLLGPLVDWAETLANKVANEGQTTDYSIG